MVKCIECKKQVDENDGLMWADGFVCTPCLYNTSSWAEPSLYNDFSMQDSRDPISQMQAWFGVYVPIWDKTLSLEDLTMAMEDLAPEQRCQNCGAYYPRGGCCKVPNCEDYY